MKKAILSTIMALAMFAGIPQVNAGEIHTAAEKGDLATVQQELKNGVPVDSEMRYGYTALMYAAMGGHLEIVKELLNSGADVNHQSVGGQTAHTCAWSQGHKQVQQYLQNYIDNLGKNPDQSGTAVDVKYITADTVNIWSRVSLVTSESGSWDHENRLITVPKDALWGTWDRDNKTITVTALLMKKDFAMSEDTEFTVAFTKKDGKKSYTFGKLKSVDEKSAVLQLAKFMTDDITVLENRIQLKKRHGFSEIY